MSVRRIGNGPIITPALDPSIGDNIQGPSLIKVPKWIPNRLGEYYLYFADHKGGHIRLAYANAVEGPWTVYSPGSLNLRDTPFAQSAPDFTPEDLAAYRRQMTANGIDENLFRDLAKDAVTPHIASPDVHVDEAGKRIVMYYHGLQSFGRQSTRVATSPDGVNFTPIGGELGRTYWRAFPYEGMTYAMTMPGVLYRSTDPFGGFEEGPTLFKSNMRHSAVLVRGTDLFVVWSEVGAAPPERLLLSRIRMEGPWTTWRIDATRELLRPETSWEGADLPLVPSYRSVAPGRVNQLRDPALFTLGERVYLIYAVAGESGLALAEIRGLPSSTRR